LDDKLVFLHKEQFWNSLGLNVKDSNPLSEYAKSAMSITTQKDYVNELLL
jgi:hypothetical protein